MSKTKSINVKTEKLSKKKIFFSMGVKVKSRVVNARDGSRVAIRPDRVKRWSCGRIACAGNSPLPNGNNVGSTP
jgi:hypothetical protein